MEYESNFSSSIFSETSSRLPDDTVFFSVFPDFSLSASASAAAAGETSASLQSLHLDIINLISPITSSYIWQHEPFSLTIELSSCVCSSKPLAHLHGKLRYGDNLEDEWFTVFLLFRISLAFPSLSIRAWDTDGEFLLIESAFHLPRWLNPETSGNRVFIRGGDLHIVPRNTLPNPSLVDSLRFLVDRGQETRAPDSVQAALKSRIADYPDRAGRNMHHVRVRVPPSVAQVLRQEPCLIALAVEGFYDRDVDAMKHAAKMEKFFSKGGNEELVPVRVTMSRAMYAQLVQQRFQAPKCYPMPNLNERELYTEAELGMKIACGMEMMYQQRKKEGDEGKGSAWSAYKKSLESSGYFEGVIPGSTEYKRLMGNAEEYYKNSTLFSRTREIVSAPVRRIDEILALPYSADDFKGQEIPPSDDDSWLYDGEDELNSALQERQKEMELYSSKPKKKEKSKESREARGSSNAHTDDFNLGDIAKTMQQFVQRVSSYKGAELPENRDFKEVDLDVDQFFKDMESITQHHGCKDTDDADGEEGSSSDMDFEDSEDDSQQDELSDEDGKDTFMHSYSDAMNEELKKTTLNNSFVRAEGESSKTNQGMPKAPEEMDEEFTPVDVDINLVKNFLESFSSQQGLPGPASNLLGLMGVRIPKDDTKG